LRGLGIFILLFIVVGDTIGFGFAAFEEVGSFEVKRFGWEVLEDRPLGLIFLSGFVFLVLLIFKRIDTI